MLKRVQTPLHSHSLTAAGYLIWVWVFQQSRVNPEEATEVVHGLECVPLCGEAEGVRFVQPGDEKASRGDLHSHLQGDHQEGRSRLSTIVHSRRTKATDMNQNNFGLDSGGKISPRGRSNLAASCPERLCSLCPWRPSGPD